MRATSARALTQLTRARLARVALFYWFLTTAVGRAPPVGVGRPGLDRARPVRAARSVVDPVGPVSSIAGRVRAVGGALIS
jgi:hypothetical protein